MSLITILRWATLIAVLFWFVVYWRGGSKIVTDIHAAATTANTRLDTALMVTIGVFSLVIVGTGILMSLGWMALDVSQNWVISLVGFLLSIAGIVGMFSCRRTLGRFWTAETSLRPDHQIIDQGPYAIVRHPIYTFAIMMYLGLGLVFPTWWNLLSAITVILAYAFKTWDEDNFLARNLPGYAAYRQRVKYRLLPGIW